MYGQQNRTVHGSNLCIYKVLTSLSLKLRFLNLNTTSGLIQAINANNVREYPPRSVHEFDPEMPPTLLIDSNRVLCVRSKRNHFEDLAFCSACNFTFKWMWFLFKDHGDKKTLCKCRRQNYGSEEILHSCTTVCAMIV